MKIMKKPSILGGTRENGARKKMLSFGLLCVAPEYQRQKLGKMLIEHSFEVARKMGYDVNIHFGIPGNYVSRGFVSRKKKNVSFVVDGNFPQKEKAWLSGQEEFCIYRNASVAR